LAPGWAALAAFRASLESNLFSELRGQSRRSRTTRAAHSGGLRRHPGAIKTGRFCRRERPGGWSYSVSFFQAQALQGLVSVQGLQWAREQELVSESERAQPVRGQVLVQVPVQPESVWQEEHPPGESLRHFRHLHLRAQRESRESAARAPGPHSGQQEREKLPGVARVRARPGQANFAHGVPATERQCSAGFHKKQL
jgi:hypothetical protein